jgi:hypothetical protein
VGDQPAFAGFLGRLLERDGAIRQVSLHQVTARLIEIAAAVIPRSTNYSSNNLTKLRASDGTTLGTFAVGTFPVAVAFDGANIWVVNSFSNTLSKL